MMSDKFYCVSAEKLLTWILNEEKEGKIFGIHLQNIFVPKTDDPFRMHRYNKLLETPVGVAAGPHTQLAQNIIAAWLCGARYIELKTVQTLDTITVSKPCIEAEDEGYNCEWSQELTLKESFNEYLNAWIIIHILRHKLGFHGSENGFIFNMSVGYDYAGILSPNVQWFLDKMVNCKEELAEKLKILSILYPALKDIKIPAQMTDNITLSTMHGCPPHEIHKIGKYFIEERKLNTTIKLNPTLLGPERLREILNTVSGFKITVPDVAFEHDLKYPDAVELIKSLRESARKHHVSFGLKLTNTLESLNATRHLPENEKMVYASGRALHPISINLAEKLQEEFEGTLDISFCAGVDVFNIADTLACGLKPITVCSDILKPGGYLRIVQYLESLKESFREQKAKSIEQFIVHRHGGENTVRVSLLGNLKEYAQRVLKAKPYHKDAFPYKNIKTKRALPEFDCVHAPCIETCAIDQRIPDYMNSTAREDFGEAFEIITAGNPLPNITGNVCDHLCQTKCTRMNIDEPLQIRAIKRFVSEKELLNRNDSKKPANGKKAAIIGAGPSGLSCAYFLALEGFAVEVFEAKSFAGGMPADSIPSFRLSEERIHADIEMIRSLGVEFSFNHTINKARFTEIQRTFDYVYLAVGAQKSKKLGIPGEDAAGVFDQLSFLSQIRRGEPVALGLNVAVIGGGNSAIDTARSANRLIGNGGKVQVIYRRTMNEMPADREEISALLKEGITVLELTAPLSIQAENDKLALRCIKMELGAKDSSGRMRPVPVENSEFILSFDTIITAIGQDVAIDFLPATKLSVNPETAETELPNIYAGGDAIRGADSLIHAVSDGKKAALHIARRVDPNADFTQQSNAPKINHADLQKKVATRIHGLQIPESVNSGEKNFALVHETISEHDAVMEAARCLSCDEVCNICTTVCPNFANVAFAVAPTHLPLYTIRQDAKGTTLSPQGEWKIKQEFQIITIRNFCNECGNCDSFCPTNGAPYQVKPKFHLTRESFDAEDHGYMFSGNTILYKGKNDLHELTLQDNKVKYSCGPISATFAPDLSLLSYDITDGPLPSEDLTIISKMYFFLMNLREHPMFS